MGRTSIALKRRRDIVIAADSLPRNCHNIQCKSWMLDGIRNLRACYNKYRINPTTKYLKHGNEFIQWLQSVWESFDSISYIHSSYL